MKLLASIILISIVNYILVAYSDGGASQNQSLIQTNSSLSVTMKDQVQINSKASSTQERRILVSGKTNLPDHTELLISVVNDATGFNAQDKSNVMNGIFSAGPLGPMKGASAGNYVIEISMPVSKVQPAAFKKS